MRSGNLNPMYGKKQSYETKQKISNAQKERYNRIRKALKEQDILDYGQTDDNARKDVLRQLLDKNDLNFNNVQQAVNFLSIMLKKHRIQEIIRQEINNLINECDKVSNENK
jgi:hypothetical protein